MTGWVGGIRNGVDFSSGPDSGWAARRKLGYRSRRKRELLRLGTMGRNTIHCTIPPPNTQEQAVLEGQGGPHGAGVHGVLCTPQGSVMSFLAPCNNSFHEFTFPLFPPQRASHGGDGPAPWSDATAPVLRFESIDESTEPGRNCAAEPCRPGRPGSEATLGFSVQRRRRGIEGPLPGPGNLDRARLSRA